MGEVIISIFILGVVMLTIMSVLSISLRELMDERDSVIATMLVQEGVELARNIRENNWAQRTAGSPTSPDAFDLSNFSSGDADNCRIDYNTPDLDNLSCNNGTNHKVLNVDANGFYSHNFGTATKFRRKIMLEYLPDATDRDSLVLTSIVTWNGSNNPLSTIVKSNIASVCTIANKCVYSTAILYDWGTAI